MLYFVLTVSLLHLLWMNWLIYCKADRTLCILSAVAPFALAFCVSSFVTLLQPIAMVALVMLYEWHFPDRRLVFMASSLLVIMSILAGTTWYALSIQRDLHEQFPMESMAGRAPTPKRQGSFAGIADRERWRTLEALVEEEIKEHQAKPWSRTEQLRRLHEETTTNFVSSEGFGVTRMGSGNVRPDRLKYRPETESEVGPMAQLESRLFSSEELEKPYQGKLLPDLTGLHFGGLRDFVNVGGFGYIKDRQHVAGFYSHQFTKMPGAWNVQVKRLELVSLLLSEQPAVYVSNELPRMKDLKKAPKRTLSDFEAKGLEALQTGDDLFVREIDSTLHMLGAVRSVEQCVKCHGGERGDLLGAFSYSLVRSAKDADR